MATNTHHILHHSPMSSHEHHVLWALLALMALIAAAYMLYHGYQADQDLIEYESTTMMGNLLHEGAFRA